MLFRSVAVNDARLQSANYWWAGLFLAYGLLNALAAWGSARFARLHEEALAAVLAQVPPDSKVAVVAVAGAFRTGKSFLLNTS